jgi:hypothetical protein
MTFSCLTKLDLWPENTYSATIKGAGMNVARALGFGAMLMVLAACANTYSSQGITGGYNEKEMEPGIWRVSYSGNGFTTYESVQTY